MNARAGRIGLRRDRVICAAMFVSLRPVLVAMAFALAASACVRTPYTHADPLQFRPSAPSRVTLDALVRRADTLGYVFHEIDPVYGYFLVHSHVLGAPTQARRSNLFVVEVADEEVRVSAVGRHVRRDGRMHPSLARELATFGEAMESAAAAVRGGAPVPAPPSAYQTEPPSAEPPPAYAPPSSALDAP